MDIEVPFAPTPGNKRLQMLVSLDHSIWYYDDAFDLADWILHIQSTVVCVSSLYPKAFAVKMQGEAEFHSGTSLAEAATAEPSSTAACLTGTASCSRLRYRRASSARSGRGLNRTASFNSSKGTRRSVMRKYV